MEQLIITATGGPCPEEVEINEQVYVKETQQIINENMVIADFLRVDKLLETVKVMLEKRVDPAKILKVMNK